MLRMGLGLAAILAPLQLFLGDQHGLNTLRHQPIKVAAMEAHWDGSKPGALVLLLLGFVVFIFLVVDAWRHKRRNKKPR